VDPVCLTSERRHNYSLENARKIPLCWRRRKLLKIWYVARGKLLEWRVKVKWELKVGDEIQDEFN
jgi:hypothetical protein